MGFWAPSKIIDVTRRPYCMPSLGGLQLPLGNVEFLNSGANMGRGDNSQHFSNWVLYSFPIIWITRGLNAGSSARAQELAGQCRRDTISRIETQVGDPYAVPNMRLCSETLVNPYPQGCKNIQRSFGLTYLAEQNYLTVRAFEKIKVPIIDPVTGKQVKDSEDYPLYTYRKEPANVAGPVRTDFPIMGGAMCPGGEGCSTEKLPDDPRGGSEGPYLEYMHTPVGGDPKSYAFDGVYVQAGGSGNFSNYGKPSESWRPSGTASGDGTLHQLRLMKGRSRISSNPMAANGPRTATA